MLKLDMDFMVTTLTNLCSIPSPSGNTSKATCYLAEELHKLGLQTKLNNKGTLIATLAGQNKAVHRTVAAHVDTLGAMVKEIKPNGRLKLSSIGGFSWNSVEGEMCLIETHSGKTYTGTILNTHASAHVFEDHAKQERKAENIEVRVDEKITTAQGAEELGISVGDFVSFAPNTRVSQSGFINSRHLDDKASVAIILGVIKYLTENQVAIPFTTNFLFSNNEEIGYGGNAGISPETGEYLVVDMGAIGEGQTTDEFCVSICAKDSSGPYHYGLRKKLVDLARENNIYHRVDIYPHYGSDASSALRAGYDIVHGLIGPGIDASHSHERTHMDALDNTARLLIHYLLSQ